MAPRLEYLDGWRGLAIVFVLIGHFFPVPGINFGAVGVNLFFVLSGLLMCRLLFVQKVGLTNFYKRRISRIVPAALFFLSTITGTYYLLDFRIEWSEVANAAFFIANYRGSPRPATMPLGHFWSLCVEEHAYVFLSLVALAARRHWVRPLHALSLCVVLSALFGIYYAANSGGIELAFVKWLRSEVSAFGILAASALLLCFTRRPVTSTPSFVCPLLVACGIALHWWSIPLPVQTAFGVGSFALAVNLLPAAPSVVHRLLSIRPLRQLGIWSFSIYLWQQPFYLLTHRHDLPAGISATLGVFCGIASFYLIEDPARRWLNSKWSKSNIHTASTETPSGPLPTLS